jgi:gliding motility-associated-like protein
VNASKKKWRYTLWDEDATFDHYVNYTSIPSSQPNADPCQTQTLNPPGGDAGHLAILNALLQNQTFKQYYVMRYFDLMNTGLSCTRMIAVLDSMINVIDPEMPAQISRWNFAGGSYAQWQSNVTALRNFILARCDSIVNGYTPCNGTTGPYVIKVNVNPPGAGTVDLNSLNITQFVFQGTYPGGVNINLTAHPNSPYCFDYWEFQNHTPTPSINDSAVAVNLTQGDSIIAHFSTGGSTPTVTSSSSSICVGDSVQLQVSSGSNFTWTPSTGLSCTTCANPTATPATTTTYSVTVSGNCGSGNSNITITVTQPPVLTHSGNTSICTGASAQLSASGGINYTWSPAAGLSCTNCATPTASPTATTTYSLIVSNGPGINCMDADTLTVFVTGECPDIFVPTGFSPNGDNNNDMFFILGDMKDLNFTVYNRWGQVVFETKDKTIGWDGTFNGKPVQSGVYAYKLNAVDSEGNEVSKNGNITIVR